MFSLVRVSKFLLCRCLTVNLGAWGSPNKELVRNGIERETFHKSQNSDDFSLDCVCVGQGVSTVVFLSIVDGTSIWCASGNIAEAASTAAALGVFSFTPQIKLIQRADQRREY